MLEENKRTISRYDRYYKAVNSICSFKCLEKQIKQLEDQEFVITVPFGGGVNGR